MSQEYWAPGNGKEWSPVKKPKKGFQDLGQVVSPSILSPGCADGTQGQESQESSESSSVA